MLQQALSLARCDMGSKTCELVAREVAELEKLGETGTFVNGAVCVCHAWGVPAPCGVLHVTHTRGPSGMVFA